MKFHKYHGLGGELSIGFTDDFSATMIGPVKAVYDGELRKDFFEEKL
jgi:diaminopimelate epimerase